MPVRPRGPVKGWEPRTERQRAILADVLEQYSQHAGNGHLPRSPRGIFYDLRPNGFGNGVYYFKPRKGQALGKMQADPERVGEVILLARRAGMIKEQWVEDGRAPEPIGPLEFGDPEAGAAWLDVLVEQARLPRQVGQAGHVEVWCEAAGIAQRLANVSGDFGVHVFAGGGYDGLKGKRTAAERVASRDVPTIALQIGDFDKAGKKIFAAVAEDVAAWVHSYSPTPHRWGWKWTKRNALGEPERLVLTRDGKAWLTVIRLAVTLAQVNGGLVELDQEGKAEAEALPADWGILAAELDRRLLPAPRELVIRREPDARETIRKLASRRWGS